MLWDNTWPAWNIQQINSVVIVSCLICFIIRSVNSHKTKLFTAVNWGFLGRGTCYFSLPGTELPAPWHTLRVQWQKLTSHLIVKSEVTLNTFLKHTLPHGNKNIENVNIFPGNMTMKDLVSVQFLRETVFKTVLAMTAHTAQHCQMLHLSHAHTLKSVKCHITLPCRHT